MISKKSVGTVIHGDAPPTEYHRLYCVSNDPSDGIRKFRVFDNDGAELRDSSVNVLQGSRLILGESALDMYILNTGGILEKYNFDSERFLPVRGGERTTRFGSVFMCRDNGNVVEIQSRYDAIKGLNSVFLHESTTGGIGRKTLPFTPIGGGTRQNVIPDSFHFLGNKAVVKYGRIIRTMEVTSTEAGLPVTFGVGTNIRYFDSIALYSNFNDIKLLGYSPNARAVIERSYTQRGADIQYLGNLVGAFGSIKLSFLIEKPHPEIRGLLKSFDVSASATRTVINPSDGTKLRWTQPGRKTIVIETRRVLDGYLGDAPVSTLFDGERYDLVDIDSISNGKYEVVFQTPEFNTVT